MAGLDSLESVLHQLQTRPQSCVFRDTPAPGCAETEAPIRRLGARSHGDDRTLLPCARRWLALDVDSVELAAGDADFLSGPAGACARVVDEVLPVAFHGAGYVWQATGSAGFKPGVRARLWFWLDADMRTEDLAKWVVDSGLAARGIDRQLYGAARIHYTAAPLLAEGVDDPMEGVGRIGRVEGGEVSVHRLLADVGGGVGDISAQVVGGATGVVVADEDLHPIVLRQVRAEAEAALRRALKRVKRLEEGERNAGVNRIAYHVGTFARWLDGGRDRARALLLKAVASRNDPTFDSEGAAVVDHGLDDGWEHPERPSVGGAVGVKLIVPHDAVEGEGLYAELAVQMAEHCPELYVRGGMVHRIRGGRIQELSWVALHGHMESCIRWERRTPAGDEWRTTLVGPPVMWAQKLHVRGEWPGMRELRGLTEVPVLRPDGTVHALPGWDEDTGLVYAPEYPVRVGRSAQGGLRVLYDVLQDFPFATGRDFSAALAAILSPLAKPMIGGPVPLFLFTAPAAGSGKSLIADVCAVCASGRLVPKGSHHRDAAEQNKTIFSIVAEARPIHCFDNVEGEFGGEHLCKAVSEREYSSRLLGASRDLVVPVQTVWYASGNNCQPGRDMHRRLVECRIDPRLESPETRTGFKHPHLVPYVLDHRAELVGAGLGILAQWTAAGRPGLPDAWRPMGGFSGWDACVRGCLAWLGAADCLPEHAVSNTDGGEVGELLRLCPQETWFTASELYRAATQAAGVEGLALGEVLDGMLKHGLKGANALRVGRLLVSYRDRVVDGRRLVTRRTRTNTHEFKVEPATPGTPA